MVTGVPTLPPAGLRVIVAGFTTWANTAKGETKRQDSPKTAEIIIPQCFVLIGLLSKILGC
jgi:hypothetical protein